MPARPALSAKQFFDIIVEPTVAEFLENRFDLRRAYLAAVVTHHVTEHAYVERLVDLKAAAEAQREYWKKRQEIAFQVVRSVAIATKHGEQGSNGYVLDGWPAWPIVGGRFYPGLSFWGDREGGVVVRRSGGSNEMVHLHKAIPIVLDEIRKDFHELTTEKTS